MEGPIFVSIGDAEKLSKFLELNPNIPRDRAFVDDYEFKAYEAAGFGAIDTSSDDEAVKQAAKNLKPPPFSAKQWWSYLTNVGGLSPIPPNMKFGEIPAGVLRLGGTFAVKDGSVIFAHSDKVPGDHPDIEAIVRLFQ